MEELEYVDELDAMDAPYSKFISTKKKTETRTQAAPTITYSVMRTQIARNLPTPVQKKEVRVYKGSLKLAPDKVTFGCLEDYIAYSTAYKAQRSSKRSSRSKGVPC